ncbi:MAG: hypothetical protein NZ899_01935 [Thermoguttaceae bacterium]|nr:hypothetical protein [Thermoguttaceae bacterium]MDW8078696.1 hypothetical protein [Thermoguttaceae bacterium]
MRQEERPELLCGPFTSAISKFPSSIRSYQPGARRSFIFAAPGQIIYSQDIWLAPPAGTTSFGGLTG